MMLRDVSLRLPCGSTYGFLGPNSADKTTAIRMLLGLLRPGLRGRPAVRAGDSGGMRQRLGVAIAALGNPNCCLRSNTTAGTGSNC